MVNIQNALKMAGKFLGNDKIQQAINLSKNVNNPQDAIKVLSTLGDPNKIIDNGISKLNSPMANKMAGLFGANQQQLDELKNEIMGLKNQTPTSATHQSQPQKATSYYDKRMQDLLNGLK